jgi:hypothetical protein
MRDKLTEFLQFVNLIFTLLRDGFYLMEIMKPALADWSRLI